MTESFFFVRVKSYRQGSVEIPFKYEDSETTTLKEVKKYLIPVFKEREYHYDFFQFGKKLSNDVLLKDLFTDKGIVDLHVVIRR